MKKTYIAPALKSHSINVESHLLDASPLKNVGEWGNKPNVTPTPTSYDDYDEMEDIEGDEWFTL